MLSGRHAVNVRRVGHAADAEAQSVDGAVVHLEGKGGDAAPCPFDFNRFSGLDRIEVENRRIIAARWGVEAIGEPGRQHAARGIICPDLNAGPLHEEEGAEIVDAVGVVGVLMGEENGVYVLDFRWKASAREGRARCRSGRASRRLPQFS
jgi:hypothetical protein